MRLKRHLLLPALVVLVAGLAAAPTARPAEPGVVALVTGNPDQTFQEITGAGAKWLRVFLFWSDLEPTTKGQYSDSTIAAYRDLLARYAQAGIKVLLVVSRSPTWETGSSSVNVPPRDPADYAGFMNHLAGAMAGVVSAYELWNEEDEAAWWGPTAPDPATYAALLKATYPAIKAADPAATVVLGGLTGNNYPYLEGVYKNGGGPYFDAAAVHTDTACGVISPYSYLRDGPGPTAGRIDQFSFLGYREVHASMVANGDGSKPIWMTELGWSTSPMTCDSGKFAGQKAGGVSEANQARFLREAYHCLAEDSYVPVAIWFSLVDAGTSGAPAETFGLLRPDHSAKPAYGALGTFAKDGDTVTDACGDFTAPAVKIEAPVGKSVFYADLPITASATDASGVARITLLADGKTIRNFTTKTPGPELRGTIDWNGAKKLSLGNHTITVLGVDVSGNTSRASVTVKKVTPGSIPQARTTTRLSLRKGAAGGRRALFVSVTSKALAARIPGKVTVSFQRRRKGRWVTAHKYTKPAKSPFVLTAKLEHGRWRARARYRGQAPFRGSLSPRLSFRA